MPESENNRSTSDTLFAKLADPANVFAKEAAAAIGPVLHHLMYGDETQQDADDTITLPIPGTEHTPELDYLHGIRDYTHDCGGGCVG